MLRSTKNFPHDESVHYAFISSSTEPPPKSADIRPNRRLLALVSRPPRHPPTFQLDVILPRAPHSTILLSKTTHQVPNTTLGHQCIMLDYVTCTIGSRTSCSFFKMPVPDHVS
ncbi:hypothetical protein NDU88_008286 [Pleurodeles waltl]|uniref:Uncharacterized protein n=1 Tax=Pleurodeles waltl TaxID=8319 RepID=A0AAV7SV83_PLEWA|nr:hypothetical protein NDU88_008286 [Pleurodeles waltl]